VKTGSNLAESSKEGYFSKRAVLPMIMMVIIIRNNNKNERIVIYLYICGY
jgi:hypothetical protein